MIYILILVMLSCTIYSQDKEAIPLRFKFENKSGFHPFNIEDYPQDFYVKGFQWQMLDKTAIVLGANSNAGGSIKSDTANQIIRNQIQQMNYQGKANGSLGIWAMASMQYEPTLYIPPLQRGGFITRPADPTNAIFGFSTIKGEILTNPADENYNRLLLRDTLLASSDSVLVLSNVWPKPNLRTFIGINQWSPFQGKKWNLSINLRRLDPTDTIIDNEVVLSMRLKYWAGKTVSQVTTLDSGYIMFRYQPIPDLNQRVHMVYYDTLDPSIPLIDTVDRGFYLKQNLDTNQLVSSNFKITRDMLPFSPMNPDITLNAEFHCSIDSENDTLKSIRPWMNHRFVRHRNYKNPFNENDYSLDTEMKIYDMELEVYYHGNTDIAIDWIRIENNIAREVFRGKLDRIGITDSSGGQHGVNHFPLYLDPDNENIKDSLFTIKETIQSNVEVLENDADEKLFRIYGQDTENYDPYSWGMIRYYNQITNGMVVVRDEPYLTKHYSYYTLSPNRYIGMVLTINNLLTAKPHLRFGYQAHSWHPYTMKQGSMVNLKNGYHTASGDSLNSDYETLLEEYENINSFSQLANMDISNKDTMELFYKFMENSTGRAQTAYIHSLLYRFYFTGDYLYESKPWWVNFFLAPELSTWKQKEGFNPQYDDMYLESSVRGIYSGYELDLMLNTVNILGGKGVLVDNDNNRPYKHDSASPSRTGVGNFYIFDSLDLTNKYDNLILSDTAGGDFADSSAFDVYNIGRYYVYDFDTTDLPRENFYPNRKYIGIKSHRFSLARHFDWAEENEETILNLELQAWYSKAFQGLYSQHPNNFIIDTALKSFVDIGNIRTRKLFQPSLDFNHNLNPDYEHRDSSFFDITLLKRKNVPLQETFYIGVLNRRTDPLIFDTVHSTPPKPYVAFYSLAEFTRNMKYGGNNLVNEFKDTTWWQENHWRKFGCREIHIPFDFGPYGNGKFIHVKELGLDSLDNIGYFYTAPYYHRIDTTLAPTGSLIANFQPGSGKILEVSFESVPGDTSESCSWCELYNDNESFNLLIEKTDSSGIECCYDISIVNSSVLCDLESIKIRLIVTGDSAASVSFNGHAGIEQDSTEYFIDSTISINSQDTILLSSLCIPSGSSELAISTMLITKDDSLFLACDRKIEHLYVSCEEEIIDCCEDINLIASTSHFTGFGSNDLKHVPLPSCGSNIYLDTNFTNNCFYGIQLEWNDKKKYTLFESDSIFNFSEIVGENGYIGEVRTYAGPCFHNPTIEGFVIKDTLYKKLQFLGKDGTVICETEIAIVTCCFNYKVSHLVEKYSPNSEKKVTTIENGATIENIRLAPNPTEAHSTLSFFSKENQNLNISLYNNQGLELMKFSNIFFKGNNRFEINSENLTSGTYYVIISNSIEQLSIPLIIVK